jgi:3-oxoacyl-[acyl-carrier protein] reductase
MMRQKAGSIINFSTIAVPLALKGESIYVASKAGVEGFSRTFAREMADFGITVNCIAPGPIDTSLIKGVSAGQISKIVSQQIIPKQFEPSAVCDLVELLLSEKSRALTGEILRVGGA